MDMDRFLLMQRYHDNWAVASTIVGLASVICFLFRQASARVGFAQRRIFDQTSPPPLYLVVRYARVGVAGGWRGGRCSAEQPSHWPHQRAPAQPQPAPWRGLFYFPSCSTPPPYQSLHSSPRILLLLNSSILSFLLWLSFNVSTM